MLKEIQANNNFANNQTKLPVQNVTPGTGFKANNFCCACDTFEGQSENKPKSKWDLALMTITGASVAALAFTQIKLGRALKLVGEKAPLTLFGRLSKISDIASKDGMTSLLNKRSLISIVSREFKTAVKDKANYSVAMLDMDNFKAINEVFDHKTGDKVLKRIAANIQEVAKKHGVTGFRYGGEEFVITLPGHSTESARQIVEEMAEAIKKDQDIQGLMPEFLKKAKADVAFISPKLTKIDTIFDKLRKRDRGGNYKKLAKEITTLLENHIERYVPSNAKVLNEFIDTISDAKASKLPSLLRINTKLKNGSTLGSELDKIHIQYNGIRNDLQKWISHVNKHKMFTISGGLVNLNDSSVVIKDGDHLVRIADAALKSAKENGKNSIITAKDGLIKRIIAKLNGEQSN